MTQKRTSAKKSPGKSTNKATAKPASKQLSSAYGRSTSRSKMVHGTPVTNAWEFSKHLIPPITSNTTFRLGSLDRGAKGFLQFGSEELSRDPSHEPILIYDRLDEPNTLLLEEHLAQLEGSESAVSFGSGMGAISSALLSVMKSGQRVIAHRNLYGCTYSLLADWLPRFGIQSTFIDVNSREHRQLLNDPNVRVLYFECVSNPSLDLADLPAIMSEVKKINKTRSESDRIITIVDNTFATPVLQNPIDLGAAMALHSATKYLGGHGDVIAGVVACGAETAVALRRVRAITGGVMHPLDGYLLHRGLTTLPVRRRQQQENAARVAELRSLVGLDAAESESSKAAPQKNTDTDASTVADPMKLVRIADAARWANMRTDRLADRLKSRRYPISGERRTYSAHIDHILKSVDSSKRRRVREQYEKLTSHQP